jgi:hypothetical protein
MREFVGVGTGSTPLAHGARHGAQLELGDCMSKSLHSCSLIVVALLATWSAACAVDSGAVTGSDLQQKTASVQFKLYSERKPTIDPGCDEFTRLTFVAGTSTVSLRGVVLGVCEPGAAGERKFKVAVSEATDTKDRDAVACGSRVLKGASSDKDGTGTIRILDHRKRQVRAGCAAVANQLVVEERETPEGAAVVRYSYEATVAAPEPDALF